MRNAVISFCLLLFCGTLIAQQGTTLHSPDGKLVFSFALEKNRPVYSISFNRKILVENSLLSLALDDERPLENCRMIKPSQLSSATESYRLTVGKTSSVKERFNKLIIYLGDGKYSVNIEVRAFNDGLAFRYVFPRQKNRTEFILTEEETQFRLSGNPVAKALLLPGFTTSHEGLYTTTALNNIKNDTLIDMPALFIFPGNIYMAITEAALLDYAGMYLIKRNGILTSCLSPLPGQNRIKVKAGYPHQSPWRVLLISDRPGALIESNIITNLCPPLAYKNINWLKPGSTTFPWWNGTVIPDSIHGGNNFETNKYYIDFCAANNIKYHTVVEYGGHEWYTNDGEGYQPGLHFDVTKPVDGLDMKQVCAYGKMKGVGIRVWTHWKALYPKLDTAFALFEKWGLSGMMVDFMDRDDQEMVNIQTEILEKAAMHNLHIQFHGAYKSTGLNRTYPNELTREGVMNYEYDKWDKLVTPAADLNIVFTRMLAGSTDYHLGGFRALPEAKFFPQNIKPYVMGTRCHMLGMYVVMENYLPMVADCPEAYINEPGFEVISQIPGTWDETRVLAAEPDKYVCIARRKGDNWYIGSIAGSNEAAFLIKLDFLQDKKYSATIYNDAADTDENADHLIIETKTVDRNASLTIHLASGGGNIILLSKLKQINNK